TPIPLSRNLLEPRLFLISTSNTTSPFTGAFFVMRPTIVLSAAGRAGDLAHLKTVGAPMMSPSNSPDYGAMIQPKLFTVLFSCSLQRMARRRGGKCFQHGSLLSLWQHYCWPQVHISSPFSLSRSHGPKSHPAKKRPRLRCCPHPARRG